MNNISYFESNLRQTEFIQKLKKLAEELQRIQKESLIAKKLAKLEEFLCETLKEKSSCIQPYVAELVHLIRTDNNIKKKKALVLSHIKETILQIESINVAICNIKLKNLKEILFEIKVSSTEKELENFKKILTKFLESIDEVTSDNPQKAFLYKSLILSIVENYGFMSSKELQKLFF